MTIDQRVTASKLQSEGFTISVRDGVLAVRGNDYRLILRDGSVRRAMGAKR